MQTDNPVSNDRLPFSDFSFSNLFQDYVAFNPDIAPFFAGDFRSTSSFRQAAERAVQVSRNRETLVQVLLEQNRRWGLDDETRSNIELLRDPASVVVITGQQLGLFLSPLYIPYKTLTTILLAEKLRADLGRPVVPVFWLAGEDHDFEEIASFTLPGANGPEKFLYAPKREGKGPVGRMALSHEIMQILDGIEAVLPASANKQELIDFLRSIYKPGVSLRDAFAQVIHRLFKNSGLVIASVDDPRLKNLCIPLFQREISDYANVTEALQNTSASLENKYHAQVHINPTNLFLMNDASRLPIDVSQDIFHLRGNFHSRDNGKTFDKATLNALVKDQPELFSPNVILRPLVQDVLFPTISYIAGPGEVAYYAQSKPAYEWANIPMPIIFPRASLTLIEPAIRKALEKYDLPFTAFKEEAPKLFRKHAIEHLDLDLEELFSQSASHVEEAIRLLREAVVSWEASLQKTAGSTRQTLLRDLDRFKEQIIKAQKRKLGHDRRRIEKIHTHLFPGGKLQERTISPLYFLNQYGLDFFSRLMRDVSLDTTMHQVIHL